MTEKAAILIAYLGEISGFGRLALKTLGRNRMGLDILLASDRTDPGIAGVRQLPFAEHFDPDNPLGVSFAALRRHPMKLADFKPFFNLLFPEVLRGYDRWGFADIDAIYSDRFHLSDTDDSGLPAISGRLGHFMVGDRAVFEAFQTVFSEYRARVPGPDLLDPARHFALDEYLFLHVVLTELQCAGAIVWNRDRPRNLGDIRPWRHEAIIGAQGYSAFGAEGGQVWGRATVGGRAEFDYVHFQKRRVSVDPALIAADDLPDFTAVQNVDGGFHITDTVRAPAPPPSLLRAARYRLIMQARRTQNRIGNHGLRARPAFDGVMVRDIIRDM